MKTYRSPARIAGILAILSVTLLSGCAASVALPAADDAINPVCASVVVALPDAVVDLPKRETNAQGTGAWGSPTSVVLRCGVPVPSPTSNLPCVLAGTVYWLRDGTNAPDYVFTTYGRDPAIEVSVEQKDGVSPGVVLFELQNAAAISPATSECTEIEDSLGADTSGDAGTDDGTSTSTPAPADSTEPVAPVAPATDEPSDPATPVTPTATPGPIRQ